MSNFTKTDPSGNHPHVDTDKCSGRLNRASSLQKQKQTNSFGFGPGCVLLQLSVCPVGGNRQIGHVLWTAGTILVEEDSSMGGEAERRSGESATDVSPEIRGRAFVTG